MRKIDEKQAFDDVRPENVIERTVTITRKLTVQHTELIRTPHGVLTGSWTADHEWIPSDDHMLALRNFITDFDNKKGPDVLNLKWERT